MFSSFAWPVLAAFGLTMVLGWIGLPLIRRLRIRQTLYENVPASQRGKQGTPTMGGLFFAFATVVIGLIARGFSPANLYCLASAVLFCAVGCVDDLLKVRRHHNEGLKPWQKILPQIVLSAALAFGGYALRGGSIALPFAGKMWNIGFWYIPLTMLAAVATVNSANLLDGLDGLCASCSVSSFVSIGLSALVLAGKGLISSESADAAATCFIASGALLAFLVFNFSPARVFMGDTGSFFIGGLLIGCASATGTVLLLVIAALPMVISSLSDILQILWCDTHKGVRLFRMTPLHHHFEMIGIPETRIVSVYAILNILLGILTVMSV